MIQEEQKIVVQFLDLCSLENRQKPIDRKAGVKQKATGLVQKKKLGTRLTSRRPKLRLDFNHDPVDGHRQQVHSKGRPKPRVVGHRQVLDFKRLDIKAEKVRNQVNGDDRAQRKRKAEDGQFAHKLDFIDVGGDDKRNEHEIHQNSCGHTGEEIKVTCVLGAPQKEFVEASAKGPNDKGLVSDDDSKDVQNEEKVDANGVFPEKLLRESCVAVGPHFVGCLAQK